MTLSLSSVDSRIYLSSFVLYLVYLIREREQLNWNFLLPFNIGIVEQRQTYLLIIYEIYATVKQEIYAYRYICIILSYATVTNIVVHQYSKYRSTNNQ